VVQRYAYSSFGKIESQLSPNFLQPYTYTARELDAETGLYYYRARYYDPFGGRFLQEDPEKYAGNSPNFYAYVLNNPLAFTDPSGNFVQLLSPDTYLDLGFLSYDFYRILADNIFSRCDNFGENLASLGADLAGLAIPGVTGLGAGLRGANKGTLVIGKLRDLERATLKSGEFILDWESKITPKLNWLENSKLIREVMAEGRPIRDASINAITGALRDNTSFLAAERNLLTNHGWSFNKGYWYPPVRR